ncbi:MAG: glycosyltransferase family 39 protein, partial [Zavarzinella sp.]|nr:glycosyltransferase family 39 protein [Zavarzinella sp.]
GDQGRRPTISWRWPTLFAWCGFLFFYGLSGPLYRTEALRAIIGQSALDGHWLTPTLYGEPFLTKPPGVYTAIGLASLPVGHVTEETARLPSALAASITVLFTFATLRRFLGDTRAFVAALLLPVSLLWLDKAPSAEIDILQLAWVSAALLSFLRAITAGEAGCKAPALAWSVAALLCVAAGFLTKWTAPAFFYLTVIPFLAWRRRLGWLLSREHLLGAMLAGLLCAGWAGLVASEVGWATLKETVLREATQRFAPQGHGKPYPWAESLQFPFVVLGAALPWSIPALFTLRPRFRNRLSESERMLVQFLHCWAWPNLLFWSLPAQHHVRYVLPVAPAITLLGVIAILKWCEGLETAGRRLTSPRVALLCALLTWAVVKVVFVESVLPARTANRNARATGEAIARLVPPGEILYLCRLKDEGVLFYYGRPARRLDSFDDPSRENSIYVLMLDAEWDGERYTGRPEYLAEFRDQQQAPIHLVKLHARSEGDPRWLGPRYPILPTSSPSPP